MSTITKERIANLLQFNSEGSDCQANAEQWEVHELARIALASLEAEAVCYLTWHQGFRAPDDCEEYVVEANPGDKSCDGSPAFPVYTAPPAPVSVPDELTREEYKRRFMEDDNFDDTFRGGWNACRAAMLQGADQAPVKQPSSNSVLGWLRADYQDDNRGLRGNAPLFVLGKKDPSTVWGLDYIPLTSNSPVIPDGWVLVPEEPTHEMLEAGDEQFGTYDVYRRMVAASPQQK
ncbi:hypothetical protein ACTJKR_01600 [Enterobacter sp. 22146]|uniref:hypothetical protein n=1 Tax=unclassified Enterobacter TaxID=2608935 RepID=UPI003F83A625